MQEVVIGLEALVDSLSIQPSNWCTIEPHESNQKERDHTWKACPET